MYETAKVSSASGIVVMIPVDVLSDVPSAADNCAKKFLPIYLGVIYERTDDGFVWGGILVNVSG